MTTIAYKGGVMACDSCWANGNVQFTSLTKIKRLGSGSLLGQAGDGDSRDVEAFLDKIKAERAVPGRSALTALRIDFHGLWVWPTGQVWMIQLREDPLDYDSGIGIYRVSMPYAAVGSGSDFALGAMAAGRSAREAVAIAVKFDVNSRNPIHSVELKSSNKKVAR